MPNNEVKEFIKLMSEIQSEIKDIKVKLDARDKALDEKIEKLRDEIPNMVENQIEQWVAKKFFAPYVIIPLFAGMSISVIGLYYLFQHIVRFMQYIFQIWK